MAKNNYYFKIYSDLLYDLLSRYRDKIEVPSLKQVIRCLIREAINHATDLPGHDNKLGASMVSEEALELIKKHHGDNKALKGLLVGEHLVPISVVNKLVLKNLPLDHQHELEKILKTFTNRAVITKKEHDKLNYNGLNKNMPEDWDGKNEKARYEKVDIALNEISYKKVLKEAKIN
ncbi:MAG TPA: hypothetical protein VIM88_00170 [Sulfurovum sp.]|uniref:hypothetical protein n=1 Tax=Sulfurovum sp. TaxID=1969726 RepID=UPI002F93FFD7